MNLNLSTLLTGILFSSLAGRAQDDRPDLETPWTRELTGWVEFGGAVVPNVDAELGVFTTTGTVNSQVELSLTPGFSVSGGLGERMNEWLGLEFQGGFLYHNVDEIQGGFSGARSLDASLLQVPLFFNVVFELPLQSRLTPYVGAGAGAMINWLDIDGQFTPDGTQVVSLDGSSTEVNFAYQLFAGARWFMGERGVVEVTYRFMSGVGPNFGLRQEDTGDTIANLNSDDIFVHALTVGFLVDF